MAREVRKFSATIPAGTAKNAPVTIPLEFPPREIAELELIIPPGPRGQMGFQIAQSGAQVFPSEPGAYFVTDNETIRSPIEGANTSGSWQLIGYNTGSFPHTVEVRFLVSLPGADSAAQDYNPIPAALISSPAQLAAPGAGLSGPFGTLPPAPEFA